MNRGRNILSLSTIQKIMFMFLVIFLLFGCKKLELERTVMVATGSVTNVSYASCSVQGTIIDKGEKGIDQHGFCWAVAQNPTTANNKTQLGSKSSTGSFSGNLTGLSASTTYYVRAYAQNKDGVFYGNQESFSTLAIKLPTVTTTSVSNTTENSAQSGGNITDYGGASVTARGVCWSTSQNPTISDNHTTNGSGIGSFTSSITGLTPNTTYYVRAYATNSVGTAYGNEISFQALSLPTVATWSVDVITGNSARSGGTIIDSGGNALTAIGVCWSTSQNPTISDNHTTDVIGGGADPGLQLWFESSITGLSPGTSYYLRAYATNSVGTGYGDEVNFTTTGQAIVSPTVTTSSASDIAETSATVGGNITADGGATVTERGVYYSTSASPETTGTKLQIGSGTGTFSTSLTGLSASTTYYIKAYATNSVGTAYGNELNFTTEQIIVSPTVTTNSASDITETSATVGGNVTDDGGATVTERGVYYSTSASPETTGTKLQIGSGTGTFSTSLTGLSAGTTYYIKAYATNSIGTSYGSEVTFTTLTTPSLTTTAISAIKENSAQSGGNVTDDGGATVTARGVCWSTSQNPTITDDFTTDGSGTGSFTSSLTGLTQNTTYYVRAYATNSVGTAYGDEVNFTTEQTIVSPTVTTSSASDIAETSATVGGNVTDDGGATVTERGVYYSTSSSPETTGTKLQIGSGTGVFSTSLTGLSAGTTYYIKAYAINSNGTSYGSEETFATNSTGSFTDTRDSHEYDWVKIGEQVWMAENLAYLPSVNPSTDGSNTDPYYYVYDYQGSSVSEAKATSNYATYGVLYNWPAAMAGASSSSANPSGLQGVCPDGWHLPSDAEWKELEMYLGMSQTEADGTGWRGIDEGGKLKETDTTHWKSPNFAATNESGFTALPGGFRYYYDDTFNGIGSAGYWWSSTEYSSTNAWYRLLGANFSYVSRSNYLKEDGPSVRCVRDY